MNELILLGWQWRSLTRDIVRTNSRLNLNKSFSWTNWSKVISNCSLRRCGSRPNGSYCHKHCETRGFVLGCRDKCNIWRSSSSTELLISSCNDLAESWRRWAKKISNDRRNERKNFGWSRWKICRVSFRIASMIRWNVSRTNRSTAMKDRWPVQLTVPHRTDLCGRLFNGHQVFLEQLN